MAAKKKKKRWRLRIGVTLLCLVVAWVLFSHLVVRRAAVAWLDKHYVGEARVPFVILWPWMDADAFGVTLEADDGNYEHTLTASRVSVDLDVFGLFGGGAVKEIHVTGLRGLIREGSDLELFKSRRAGTGTAIEAGDDVDLDPPTIPPIRFTGPRIDVVDDQGRRRELVRADTALLEQRDARSFKLIMTRGVIAYVPFEKLKTRLVPRRDRLLVDRFKIHAFDGLAEGYLEIRRKGTGDERVNGQLEWRSVELRDVARTYGLSHAEEMDGRLQGEVVFQGKSLAPSELKGKGRIKLTDGNFVSPVTLQVVLVLDIPVDRPSVFSRAEATFSFEGRRIYIEAAKGYGSSFDLTGQGIVTFGGFADLEVTHHTTTVAVTGKLNRPRVKILPLNHITRPFERLFRERLPDE